MFNTVALQAAFKRKVAETVCRASQGFDPSFAVVELNGLKIAEVRASALRDSRPLLCSQAAFKREVAETVLRCASQGFDPSFAVVELNGLKIAEDRTFADCASAILTTLLGMCFAAPARTKPENAKLYAATPADVSTQVRSPAMDVGLLTATGRVSCASVRPSSPVTCGTPTDVCQLAPPAAGCRFQAAGFRLDRLCWCRA